MTTRLFTVGGVLLACVSLSAGAACSITGMNNHNFQSASTQSNISNYYLAEVSVSCDVPYQLGLDAGLHFSGTRQLAHNSGATLAYEMYQGATTTPWGSQTLANNPYPAAVITGAAGSQTYSIYASATTLNQTPSGLYTDTVTVQLADAIGKPIALSTLPFSLNLPAICTLDNSALNGNFGIYPLGSANLKNVALGSLSVTCPNNVAYQIGINSGENVLVGQRRMMLAGSSFIPYRLKYQGAEWGDQGLHTLLPNYNETYPFPSITHLGSGSPQAFAITGDADIQAISVAGTYTDHLIITLAW